jgi:uncharacterized protein YjiS (DUF1127 family)
MAFANLTTADANFETGAGRPSLTPAGRTFVAWLAAVRDRRRARRAQRRNIRALRGLDSRTLRDIGIDRSEIVSAVVTGREKRCA